MLILGMYFKMPTIVRILKSMTRTNDGVFSSEQENYLICFNRLPNKTPFNTFANRADPDQAALARAA